MKKLHQGIVHLPQFLTLAEQKLMTSACLPFFGGSTSQKRSRVYDALNNLPRVLQTSVERVIHSLNDTQIKQPTHAIMLLYNSLATPPHIPWHRDNGENDGLSQYPVVSFSLGDTCEFLMCHDKPLTSVNHQISDPVNLSHRIPLKSGDVLIFGGQSRFVWHSIYKMHPGSSPLPDLVNQRINITFRYTPHIFQRESEFKQIDTYLAKSNKFYSL